jgi:agmatinase
MEKENLRSGQDANRGYSGVPTFLRSPYCEKIEDLDADYAILGVPYDEGSPFVGGSRFCARSVREHSLRFRGALYDIENDKEYLKEALKNKRIIDVGDIDVVPSRGDKTMEKVTTVVTQIQMKGAMPVILGGDHTITYPVVRAYKKPIHVIQLDAHMDYDPISKGMTYINSTSFRLLHELKHVKSLTQVGIRSMRDKRQNILDARENGSTIVTMPEVRKNGPGKIINHLPEGEDCYVSIDVDAYDMSLVPGCVSGEPGGFTFDELKISLQSIARKMNVVGLDFVEVNPSLDVGTGSTSYLGALTVSMFLGFIDEKVRMRK